MISGWELVIGIEIHAQVKSKSKLFSLAICNTAEVLPIPDSPTTSTATGFFPCS